MDVDGVIRIERGEPDAVEVAALVAVLRTACQQESGDPGPAPGHHRRRQLWARSGPRYQPPDAWTYSSTCW